MNFSKFLKSSKAISPIFATLILIAIVIIAGVVIYMFTSSHYAAMTSGVTTAQEEVSIEGVAAVQATKSGNFTVWAEPKSTAAVSINSAIIKNANGNVLTVIQVGPTKLNSGALTKVTGNYAFVKGSIYSITLVSARGGTFVSPSFESH